MKLEICCAMCGQEKQIKVEVVDGKIDAAKHISDSGWIVQQNGSNFDVYCSKKCAA